MPTHEDRPYLGCNFLVDLGDHGDAGASSAGFVEVIFPPFRIEPARPRPAKAAGQSEPSARENVNRLVLRRGASAARDLYLWWDKTRTAKTSKGRTVTIRLLGEDHEQVLTTWRFSNARPVALSYTPLNALEAAVLMETIELEFDSVEML